MDASSKSAGKHRYTYKMNSAHLLALLTLFVAWVDCFSWDIVVSEDNRLQFYNNGTLSHTEFIPSAKEIHSIAYDPVHNRVLFSDYQSSIQQISSFDLSTWSIQPLVTRTSGVYLSFVYDPVTQQLFFLEGLDNIYSISLNPASSNKAVDDNLIIKSNVFCRDIAVDSCGGYIYWATNKEIERARFDGSKREVLINSTVYWRMSLIIDQQTQKMYWTEKIHSGVHRTSIESADFNGKNRRTLFTVENEEGAGSLTVSNDFIYWHGDSTKAIWQLPKNLPQHLITKQFSTSNNENWYYHVIAANYKIKQQLKENQNCETLKSLIPNESEPDCIGLMLCAHGTKVSGYTGERCDIYVCQNYCLQGNCSVSAEGQPKCSCNAGYSGERCEINVCYKHCLNNGVCSLSEEDEPVCECMIDYEGDRCDVATAHTGVHTDNTTQHVLRDLRRQVKQIIKEELKRAQQFFSDKIDEY